MEVSGKYRHSLSAFEDYLASQASRFCLVKEWYPGFMVEDRDSKSISCLPLPEILEETQERIQILSQK
jgi:hypothetical protein